MIGEDFEDSVCISVRKDNVSGVCSTIIFIISRMEGLLILMRSHPLLSFTVANLGKVANITTRFALLSNETA